MSTEQKTILVTGATDGIGLATAGMLVSLGHRVLLHGRNRAKLEEVRITLSALPEGGNVESCVADLSRMADVKALAKAVAEQHVKLDVLINGVAGGDLRIGADILTRAALADEFQMASGRYFDNDSGRFASPHPDALNPQKSEAIVRAIEAVLAEISPSDEN